MIDFLANNWKLFVILGAILCDLVLVIFVKKRPQVIDNSLVLRVCSWILVAENKFKVGSDKMNYVLNEASKYLGENYSESDVKKIVEYLLTVPEKKEK